MIQSGDIYDKCQKNELIYPFVEMAKSILPDRFGVVPSPMDLQLIESKSTISDDKNKVDNLYASASDFAFTKSFISSISRIEAIKGKKGLYKYVKSLLYTTKVDKAKEQYQKEFKKNYIKFAAQANKFKLDNRITDIMKKLFLSGF